MEATTYPQTIERSARLSCVVAPSRYLAIFLCLATVQALVLLWLCRLPLLPLAVLLVAVLLCGTFEWRRLRRQCGTLSTRERRWFWRDGDGAEREFEFCGELVLWTQLLVINGRFVSGGDLRLVLARDSVHADDWRRLQAALHFSR
ncbi:protein YgfX [Microbulbifer sp. SAOS-129_SWC]|uniref:protein YgfX n=1 Tax=Microbulbifer sp. SAOS-129_SWC TaxID=3145235 RepID=UPI0032169E77